MPADPPSRTAARLGHVIVRALVNDDCGAVLVKKRWHLPAGNRDAGCEELRLRGSVGCRFACVLGAVTQDKARTFGRGSTLPVGP